MGQEMPIWAGMRMMVLVIFQYTPNYTPDYTAEDHPTRYYAGLLSNTDLGVPFGAPAEGGEVRATWVGLLGGNQFAIAFGY